MNFLLVNAIDSLKLTETICFDSLQCNGVLFYNGTISYFMQCNGFIFISLVKYFHMLTQKNILKFILTFVIVYNAMVWWTMDLFCMLLTAWKSNEVDEISFKQHFYFWHISYKVFNTLMFLQDNMNIFT